MNYRFAVTKLLNQLLNHVPYFQNFDDVTNTVARCFSQDAFHCHTPLKNVKFDLFDSEKYRKYQFANLVANRLVNCDSPTGCGMQNTIYKFGFTNTMVNRWNSLPTL